MPTLALYSDVCALFDNGDCLALTDDDDDDNDWQVITALARLWHPEHFVCVHCKETLGTRNFFERDSLPYCEQDYHLLFSPRCAFCSGPILDVCAVFCCLFDFSFFSSAGWTYQIGWSSAVSVWVCVCLDVNQGGTNRNCYTQRLSCVHRLTNEPWLHAETKSGWPTFWVKIAWRKKWAWIYIFKTAKPHSP